ncbi:MAG: 4a-hydroxytetrahydrobiopterin dehydratase [Candidatus Dormibacteria bacterium]|jgi:4a-hydroxytetrahydrobiopterin dehydratase
MAASDRAPAITPEDAYRALNAHPGWVVERDRLRRDFRLASFKSAMELITRVAAVAQAENHHPNIRLHEWCFVELELYSHVSGGLTARDVQLAIAIDAAVDSEATPT